MTYTTRLQEKAKDCEFGTQLDDRLLEHLIQTITDEYLIKKCIQKKWNLDRFLEEANQKEDISKQISDMKVDLEIAKVHTLKAQTKKEGGGTAKPPKKTHYQKHSNSKFSAKRGGNVCNCCGKTDAHKPGQGCEAFGKQCLKCGQYNHYAICCQSGQKPPKRVDLQNRQTCAKDNRA